MLIGLLSSIVLIVIDWNVEKKYKKYNEHNETLINKDEDVTFCDSFKNLTTLYWVLLFNAIFFYGALNSFNFIITGYLTENYFNKLPKEEAENLAGFYMSIQYIIGTVFIPIIGIIY